MKQSCYLILLKMKKPLLPKYHPLSNQFKRRPFVSKSTSRTKNNCSTIIKLNRRKVGALPNFSAMSKKKNRINAVTIQWVALPKSGAKMVANKARKMVDRRWSQLPLMV
jgi:hypothetical protein